MTKKYMCLVLCLMTLILSGCAKEVIDGIEVVEGKRFIKTGDTIVISESQYSVIYDSKTMIVYLSNGDPHGVALSVMYNEDRMPMTLEEYKESK